MGEWSGIGMEDDWMGWDAACRTLGRLGCGDPGNIAGEREGRLTRAHRCRWKRGASPCGPRPCLPLAPDLYHPPPLIRRRNALVVPHLTQLGEACVDPNLQGGVRPHMRVRVEQQLKASHLSSWGLPNRASRIKERDHDAPKPPRCYPLPLPHALWVGKGGESASCTCRCSTEEGHGLRNRKRGST